MHGLRWVSNYSVHANYGLPNVDGFTLVFTNQELREGIRVCSKGKREYIGMILVHNKETVV